MVYKDGDQKEEGKSDEEYAGIDREHAFQSHSENDGLDSDDTNSAHINAGNMSLSTEGPPSEHPIKVSQEAGKGTLFQFVDAKCIGIARDPGNHVMLFGRDWSFEVTMESSKPL